GRFPVTRGEYEVFAKDQGITSGPGDWRDSGFPQTDRDPVILVSLAQAEAYIAWLSRKTGHTYRLPSEAEWEYAARAGTRSPWFWGDRLESGAPYAWSIDQWSRRGTSPVGEHREPNVFGLYDMVGNVQQWTADCFNDSYNGAPTDGSAWRTGDCKSQIKRGGSWHQSLPGDLRTGRRFWDQIGNED